MSAQLKTDASPQRELRLVERYRPQEEALARETVRDDKMTGSVTLDYAQGTLVAVTVHRKIRVSN